LDHFKDVAAPVYDFGLTMPANFINPVAPIELLLGIGERVLEIEKAVVEGQGVKEIRVLLRDGDAAEQIVETAKKEVADFIVMGRRGLGAVQGILMGSVSAKVSHLAEATVVSVT
jgi:nucleotide-binding universal stress UspA family protein